MPSDSTTPDQDTPDQYQALQIKLNALEEDNVLLLEQLSQVQGELEYYFQQHQKLNKKLRAMKHRWQRMFERNPEWYDYERIEAFLTGDAPENAPIKWKIQDLIICGREFPSLEFATCIQNGIAGFILYQTETDKPLLQHWPSSARDNSEVVIIPGDTCGLPADLATSDCTVLHLLNRILSKAIKNPDILRGIDINSRQIIRNALLRCQENIAIVSPVLRFDYVRIKNEHINPDYEHLFITMDNLIWDTQQYPVFDFRIACALVTAHGFGLHPKLEFPESIQETPFKNWFEESRNCFGSNLELRFALPEAMDINVWERMSDIDQRFVAALIERLPFIISMLYQSGCHIGRSWKEWLKMTEDIQRILSVRVINNQSVAVNV